MIQSPFVSRLGSALVLLVAMLAAFVSTARAQLPAPAFPPITQAFANSTVPIGFPGGPGPAACPDNLLYTSLPNATTLTPYPIPGTPVWYSSACEDLSQPGAGAYLAVCVVSAAPFGFAPGFGTGPTVQPGYVVPGFAPICNLTNFDPTLVLTFLAPTHQDTGPTLGFPRYWVGFSLPSTLPGTPSLALGYTQIAFQWITINNVTGALHLGETRQLIAF